MAESAPGVEDADDESEFADRELLEIMRVLTAFFGPMPEDRLV
jgi:hypothetical protein